MRDPRSDWGLEPLGSVGQSFQAHHVRNLGDFPAFLETILVCPQWSSFYLRWWSEKLCDTTC